MDAIDEAIEYYERALQTKKRLDNGGDATRKKIDLFEKVIFNLKRIRAKHTLKKYSKDAEQEPEK